MRTENYPQTGLNKRFRKKACRHVCMFAYCNAEWQYAYYIAPAAESAYRAYSGREERDAYVTVRVLNGFAVLEELYVASVPICEFIRKNPGK